MTTSTRNVPESSRSRHVLDWSRLHTQKPNQSRLGRKLQVVVDF